MRNCEKKNSVENVYDIKISSTQILDRELENKIDHIELDVSHRQLQLYTGNLYKILESAEIM